VLTFVFLSCLLVGILLTVFRKALTQYIFAGTDYYPLILVCLLQVLFYCQHTIHTYILQSQQRAMKSSILGLLCFFVTVGLNILFVVGLELGAVGVQLASMITSFLYTIYFWIDMGRKKEIAVCLDFGLLKEALKYSIPLMPHNLSTQIAQLVSRVLIGGSGALGDVGIYSVASQFGNIADTLQSYVDSAYGPWLYEKLHDHEEGYKSTIKQASGLLAAVIGLFMLGIALFAQDYILLFVDKSFANAWRYVPWIVLVFALKTMYYFYVEVLFYYKKASKLLFTATLTGSIVNVIVSALLIPMWGVYGSIAADGIAMVLRVGIVVFISLRFENVGLKVFDFIQNFIIVASFVFLGLAPSYLYFQNTFHIQNFLFKALVVLAYVGVQLFVYRKIVGRFGKALLMKIRNRKKAN
jgi:O-antigen/teichoic acid export membrane protein